MYKNKKSEALCLYGRVKTGDMLCLGGISVSMQNAEAVALPLLGRLEKRERVEGVDIMAIPYKTGAILYGEEKEADGKRIYTLSPSYEAYVRARWQGFKRQSRMILLLGALSPLFEEYGFDYTKKAIGETELHQIFTERVCLSLLYHPLCESIRAFVGAKKESDLLAIQGGIPIEGRLCYDPEAFSLTLTAMAKRGSIYGIPIA